jgi:hypothetical protein
MLKKLFSCALMVVLVSILLPATAIAGSPQPLHLNVRNQSGGVVTLNLTDANGGITFFQLESGVYAVELTEGVYSYWASTPCGNVAGSWNVNVSKVLFLSCKSGLTLRNQANSHRLACSDFGLYFSLSGINVFLTQTHFGEQIGEYWEGTASSYEEAADMLFGISAFSAVEGCITDFSAEYYFTNITL